MINGFKEITPADVAAALEGALLPSLVAVLKNRSPGHCMRILDLDDELAVRLCARLRAEVPQAQTVVLTTTNRSDLPPQLAVTSSKLVELRNPKQDGTLGPPLLVFVPAQLRTSAEDSFGIATFEELRHGDVYETLKHQLLGEIPLPLRGAVAECLSRLVDADGPWPFADALASVRFLLTAKLNGGTADVYGASLFELGLVPDFDLLTDTSRAAQRIARNRECVQKLTWSAKTERGRVGELGLANAPVRDSLGTFLADAGVEDPRQWTKRIVLDRQLRPLAFDRWEFADGNLHPDSICVKHVVTDLPKAGDSESNVQLQALGGQQFLAVGPDGQKKFSVSFSVSPHPARVRGLDHFVCQVISKDRGPVGLSRSRKCWKTVTSDATVTFTNLSKIEWEDGWHYVRVLAQSEDGEFIPLVGEDGEAIAWVGSDEDSADPRPNRSDLFYVIAAKDVEVEQTQRAVPHEESVTHSALRAHFLAASTGQGIAHLQKVEAVWGSTRGKEESRSDSIEARIGTSGAIRIPISRRLKTLEQKILCAPRTPLAWRMSIDTGTATSSSEMPASWPTTPLTDEFLRARETYFNHIRQGEHELITQACDFRSSRDLVLAYARTYQALLEDLLRRAGQPERVDGKAALEQAKSLLAIDCVAVSVSTHRGRPREVVLVSPTHPLRALWLATWSELGVQWAGASSQAPREYMAAARDAILREMAATNFPPVLPMDGGRLFTPIDDLNSAWTVYAPSGQDDPRGILSELCSAFGISEPPIGGAALDGEVLATRVRRYLLQHPYVTTLVINAFNPGRATALADMLIALQSLPECETLRYEVRLFARDVDGPQLGEALSALLDPSGSISARNADAFAVPSGSHLHPKLRLAIMPLSEFRAHAEQYASHLTVMFDLFPATEVGASPATLDEATAPVHGLVQDFQVCYAEDASSVSWTKQPRHGDATPLIDAEECSDLLASLSRVMSAGTAAVSTGQFGMTLRPHVRMALDSDGRALLHTVHEISDWVISVDRHLGIEFFDHGGATTRPDYLIDYAPEGAGLSQHKLVVTSRSLVELEAMLKPVLEEHGLAAAGRHAVAVLTQLRSLSGQLALKLLSSSTQRSEVLGLALARMFLSEQGAVVNQVVVPLDSHIDLYHSLRGNAEEPADAIGFKRTDLALFDLNVATRTITCRLVEVKCYRQVGDASAFADLRTRIAEQIRQTEEVLSRHFDPHRTTIDRPDRLLKTKQLATLLEFYLDRSDRYGLMTAEAKAEARYFLRTLEDGYRFAFTRSALVFDFERPGTEPAELEGGIEFHRIGIDLIRHLMEGVAPESDSGEAHSAERPHRPDGGLPSGTRTGATSSQTTSLPRLAKAAFVPSERDRTVSWEHLRARRALGESAVDTSEALSSLEKSVASVVNAEDTMAREDPAVQGRDSMTLAVPPSEVREPHAMMPPPASRPNEDASPEHAVVLGTTMPSPQFGIMGEYSGRKVALDLNQTHTISLFGVQGGGKSYTLGAVVEMASLRIPNVNRLPSPLASVIFHYSPTQDYRPEFTSMTEANPIPDQIELLRVKYGAEPRALSDVVLLTPSNKVDARRREYPDLQVHPLRFATSELQSSHWRFLMGAVGNQATYIRQINRIMKSLREDLSLQKLRDGIADASMPDHIKELATGRLDLAAEYVSDDATPIKDLVRPGRLIIVDLRDEFIEKDEALGLFVVLLQLFGDAKVEGVPFNKLVVFDEAHKYIESPDLVAGLVEVVREMRHKGTSIMVASQDPPSVPVSLIELSSVMILHKFNSPAWLKHLQKANAALGALTAERMAALRPGEAYVWASKATDEAFSNGVVRMRLRPRVTKHGGDTRTAT